MGLKYVSGESSSLISTMENNIRCANQLLDDLGSGSERLIAAVDGHTLSGAAYQAGKGLFSELVRPTIQEIRESVHFIQTDLELYKTADSKVAHQGILDEANINQQIAIKRTMQLSAQATAAVLGNQASSLLLGEANRPLMSYINRLFGLQSQLTNYAESLGEDIAALEKKLQLLQNFASETNSLFSESLSNLEQSIQAVVVIQGVTLHSDGSYDLPSSSNLYEQFKSIMDSDSAKRLSQLMSLLPKNVIKAVLKSDGFWEILSSVEKTGAKGDKFVTAVLAGLAKYESMGKFGTKTSKGFGYLQKFASPVKSTIKWGLEKASGVKSLATYVNKGGQLAGFWGKAVKVAGKAGTVLTVADLTITGVSSGLDEFRKSGDVGKAVGKGALSAVASVGPLEGATLGAAVGSVIPIIGTTGGAIAGAVIGGIIQGMKAWKPDFFDNPVKGTKEIVNDVGKGIKGAVNAVSNVVGGVGKVLGFG
ncbi:hypothetical protein [Streptococcus cuniculi]|uniref:Uncharacterized protein n=1 Tax=Streptococcus cuniculi TaxID=1432788 RepID=A0A4Y9JEX6_9STRE|nr:hypothetical protein [Streptococcus cuniculi]MBF0777459.1 hypothetical protein [Streptococcus cuniculi]TFU98514.1 hypothetical protein E4T82_01735 [Streptococcus cuniculi]